MKTLLNNDQCPRLHTHCPASEGPRPVIQVSQASGYIAFIVLLAVAAAAAAPGCPGRGYCSAFSSR